MYRVKFLVILIFMIGGVSACFHAGQKRFIIAESNGYEASLFRQHCAICHGSEGDGKKLVDGTIVPSLRGGNLKAVTEAQIYRQIVEGGNGMVPFRSQLSDREIRLMVDFVVKDLRMQ